MVAPLSEDGSRWRESDHPLCCSQRLLAAFAASRVDSLMKVLSATVLKVLTAASVLQATLEKCLSISLFKLFCAVFTTTKVKIAWWTHIVRVVEAGPLVGGGAEEAQAVGLTWQLPVASGNDKSTGPSMFDLLARVAFVRCNLTQEQMRRFPNCTAWLYRDSGTTPVTDFWWHPWPPDKLQLNFLLS